MIKFVEQPVAQARYDMCKICAEFNKTLYTCKKCGCFMKVKVKLIDAECPRDLWPKAQVNNA
jgi:hypothetical protein